MHLTHQETTLAWPALSEDAGAQGGFHTKTGFAEKNTRTVRDYKAPIRVLSPFSTGSRAARSMMLENIHRNAPPQAHTRVMLMPPPPRPKSKRLGGRSLCPKRSLPCTYGSGRGEDEVSLPVGDDQVKPEAARKIADGMMASHGRENIGRGARDGSRERGGWDEREAEREREREREDGSRKNTPTSLAEASTRSAMRKGNIQAAAEAAAAAAAPALEAPMTTKQGEGILRLQQPEGKTRCSQLRSRREPWIPRERDGSDTKQPLRASWGETSFVAYARTRNQHNQGSRPNAATWSCKLWTTTTCTCTNFLVSTPTISFTTGVQGFEPL